MRFELNGKNILRVAAVVFVGYLAVTSGPDAGQPAKVPLPATTVQYGPNGIPLGFKDCPGTATAEGTMFSCGHPAYLRVVRDSGNMALSFTNGQPIQTTTEGLAVVVTSDGSAELFNGIAGVAAKPEVAASSSAPATRAHP